MASDAAGRFAILWTAVCVPEPDQGPIPLPCTPNPLKSGTFGRWYDTAGRPVGPEIQLSDFVEQFPRPLGVAVGGDGSFFAVSGSRRLWSALQFQRQAQRIQGLDQPGPPNQSPVVTAVPGGYAVT